MDKHTHTRDWAIIAMAIALAFISLPGLQAQSKDLGYYVPASSSGFAISPFAADAAKAGAESVGAVNAGTFSALDSQQSDIPPLAAIADSSFLGFPDKVAFHRFSGWMAGGTLLAAGLVGGVHFLTMMSEAHAYRDSKGITEFNPNMCPGEIDSVYNSSDQQTLRWVHVGLLATGELFYVANAVTGSGFMGPLEQGWSKAKIHRYAFFTHAGLMLGEAVLGAFLSEALQSQSHQSFEALGGAHAAIGIAIPVVILGAGAIMGSE
jgi:hypothetical protein